MSNELSTFGLSAKQEEAAVLEAYGGMDVVAIAKAVGVTRQTIYSYRKKKEYIDAIDTFKQEKKNMARSFFLNHLDEAVTTLSKLMRSSDQSIALKASREFIHNALGKPTSNVQLNTSIIDHGANAPKDILEMEDEEFEQRMLSGDTDEYEDE